MLKPGDRVVFLNESGGGTIKSISGDSAMVEDDTGFEMPHLLSDIILENREAERFYNAIADNEGFFTKDLPKHSRKIKSSAEGEGTGTFLKARFEGDFMEIDLHIHELVSSSRHLSNSEMIAIQMNHFYKAMEVAIAKKMRKIVFIHGIGKGVLRSEIRRELGMYPNCRFFDAPYTEYGYGATEVVLWFN